MVADVGAALSVGGAAAVIRSALSAGAGIANFGAALTISGAGAAIRCTAGACLTGLARGTTHTGASAGVACEALAAITRATRATVADTVAAAISRTTNRRGESCRGTRRAQARAMGSITGTSSCRRRIGTKDGCAPLGTGLILRKGGAHAAQTEDAAKRSSGDEFDGLTA
jgi:hypothetical protein